MKRMLLFLIVFFTAQVCGMANKMQLSGLVSQHSLERTNVAKNSDADAATGKKIVQHVRQGAAVGAVMGGWGFFAATAARNTSLPYWAKRLPLAVFLFSSTVGHLPTLFGVDNDPKKLAAVGNCVKRQ